MPVWLIQLIIVLILQLIIALLTPRPKAPKPAAAEVMENPTADADKPVNVIFGTVWKTDPNILGYWEKNIEVRKIKP